MEKYRNGVIIITMILCFAPGFSTTTMYFNWHAAYFDAEYVENLGSDLEEVYPRILIERVNFIIRLDSLLKATNPEKGPDRFVRWRLRDNYHLKFKQEIKKPGDMKISGNEVFLNFTDSIGVRKALARLWNIEAPGFNPTLKAGQWLYALHIGIGTNAYDIDSLDKLEYTGYDRPDTNLVWFKCESGVDRLPYVWFQKETDGYYHLYTGLYLTTGNAREAQKLLKDLYGLEPVITSQYVTPPLIRKYIGRK